MFYDGTLSFCSTWRSAERRSLVNSVRCSYFIFADFHVSNGENRNNGTDARKKYNAKSRADPCVRFWHIMFCGGSYCSCSSSSVGGFSRRESRFHTTTTTVPRAEEIGLDPFSQNTKCMDVISHHVCAHAAYNSEPILSLPAEYTTERSAQ